MFEELLADLDQADVRFVVVGGLAVVIHGYARLTADVDLAIADSVILGSRAIRVASIEDLIRMKRSAGRPQDAIDIQHLEEISRRRHGR